MGLIMKYLIIAFKSRFNLQNFVRNMQRVGITASIINTPHSISISCGLSARTEYRYLNSVLNLIKQTDVETLIGVYAVTRNGVYEQVEKIY